MKYTNKPVPEGINTSKTHPLRTFLTLLLLFLVLLGFGTWLLGKSGAWLATWIPFDKEVALANNLEFNHDSHPDMENYLQTLADELLREFAVVESIRVKVHYLPDPVLNAFATIGGHVIFHRGLLQSLKSENALAMLIAHELAHIKLRHPIASLGQGLAIQVGLQLLIDRSDLQIAGLAGQLTQMSFSRTMELDADRQALRAVNRYYGHTAGALDLYSVLINAKGTEQRRLMTDFMATHPLTEKRVEALRDQLTTNGWESRGELTPLPADFAQWLTE